MGQRLIDANALMETIKAHDYPLRDYFNSTDSGMFTFGIQQAVDEQPTVDAVPIGAVEQIRWERDMAMQQLSEHGIPFGGKADDVIKVCRCGDCKHHEVFKNGVNGWCNEHGCPTDVTYFCADGERRN